MLRIGKYSENLKVLSQTIIVTNDFAVVLWMAMWTFSGRHCGGGHAGGRRP